MDDEVKYRKRKQSNTSKARRKSDHKHENTDCVFIGEERDWKGNIIMFHRPASVCKICGKIDNVVFCPSIKASERGYRAMTEEEFDSAYGSWIKVRFDGDIWKDKFISEEELEKLR